MHRLRKHYAIFSLVFLACLARSISLAQSFWLDEAAQAVLSTKPFFQVNYGADFQPPFFYVLAHLWMKLGMREWVVTNCI